LSYGCGIGASFRCGRSAGEEGTPAQTRFHQGQAAVLIHTPDRQGALQTARPALGGEADGVQQRLNFGQDRFGWMCSGGRGAARRAGAAEAAI
jgi:hypothetical protein